uniref:Link domain-containing protein n=1 Tax=Fundulus heteroclitus TaxID=8078 RepID=A0A3Q2Q7S9_FUNHE
MQLIAPFHIFVLLFLSLCEVFHTSVPGRLSLSSASDRCVSLGGQLATVGQLYLAWRAGLESCAPGWLSDGSVRYPVAWPRPQCGGSQPGVHTITPNTTADNTTALYGAYCYRGTVSLYKRKLPPSPMRVTMATFISDPGFVYLRNRWIDRLYGRDATYQDVKTILPF